MLRITDTDFLPAAFGVQTNRLVRKDREADHTFISDNFDAESADILIVAGRGIKKKEDLSMLEDLADLLNGQLAVTKQYIYKHDISLKIYVISESPILDYQK